MDFYPYSTGPENQTIFSIFNTASGFDSLRVQYLSGKLNVWMNPTSSPAYYVLNSFINVQVAPGNKIYELLLKIFCLFFSLRQLESYHYWNYSSSTYWVWSRILFSEDLGKSNSHWSNLFWRFRDAKPTDTWRGQWYSRTLRRWFVVLFIFWCDEFSVVSRFRESFCQCFRY